MAEEGAVESFRETAVKTAVKSAVKSATKSDNDSVNRVTGSILTGDPDFVLMHLLQTISAICRYR